MKLLPGRSILGIKKAALMSGNEETNKKDVRVIPFNAEKKTAWVTVCQKRSLMDLLKRDKKTRKL